MGKSRDKGEVVEKDGKQPIKGEKTGISGAFWAQKGKTKRRPRTALSAGGAEIQCRKRGKRLQVEVTLCIVEADALDDLLQSLLVVGILAVLDPLADDVAQDAAEVIVAGVAQEAAAVGQHTHKVAQQAKACQTDNSTR